MIKGINGINRWFIDAIEEKYKFILRIILKFVLICNAIRIMLIQGDWETEKTSITKYVKSKLKKETTSTIYSIHDSI